MLHYATLCYTTTTATTLYNAMLLQLRYTTPQLHLHLRAALRYTRTTSIATTTTSTATRHCTTLGYTAQYYVTIHNSTLHDTNYTTPQIQLQPKLQLPTTHHTNYITLQLQLNKTTLQLQLPLHYTKLHPAVVGQVTTATTPKNTIPTTFLSMSGSAINAAQQVTSPILPKLLPILC